jgi:RNA polymerase sigma-70 factor (ECF subfamily)
VDFQPPERDGVPFACVLAAWRDHEAELHRYLRHRLDSAEAADDLLQDVFVKAMRQGAAFCTLAQPRAWLFQVARNALVDHARLRHPAEPLPDELAAPHEEPAPVDALAASIDQVLPLLDAADQAVLRSCDLQGQTQQAFADAHGLSLPAVKSRLLRARQRLREQLIRHCQVRFDAQGQVCCHVPPPPAPARQET